MVLIPYCNWTLNPKSSGLSANIVWAEGTDGELEGIGRFPVRYKTSMGESLFSADYYREMIYAHVDNINLLYVALTRAVESLHIFIPQKGAKGPNVGQLILQNIAPEDGTVRLGRWRAATPGTKPPKPNEFGEFAGPEPDTHRKAKAAHVLLGDYPTSEPQLQLRLPTERYYEEEGRAELTPRDFGILMHRVFENAATTDEIYTAIEAMTQDGVLDEKEAPRLRELVEKALADPVTAEWFGGRWQVVRNENEIILPGSGTTRRPDRVMTDGERAVVVDYKFGRPGNRTPPQTDPRVPAPAAADGLHPDGRLSLVCTSGTHGAGGGEGGLKNGENRSQYRKNRDKRRIFRTDNRIFDTFLGRIPQRKERASPTYTKNAGRLLRTTIADRSRKTAS